MAVIYFLSFRTPRSGDPESISILHPRPVDSGFALLRAPE
jgi:hypothetical protein